ncbi:MAG: hypothetical protein K2X29_08170 [Candidatus Obscuribacterales bacterium]|nr:hypothetical protein [Candidatus Obscuribacterales bacterium]
MIKKVLPLAAVLLAHGASVQAEEKFTYPKKGYDANYEVVNPQGTSNVRMASNGKGKTLTETSGAYKTTTVTDYNAKKSHSLIHAQKMVSIANFDPSTAASDDTTMKKKGAKFLGEKSISGRTCKGWSYTFTGGDSEIWSDKDNILVKSVTNSTAGGKTTMILKSIKDQAPPDSHFTIPADYKKIGG